MTNPVKEQFATDLQKAKTAGGARVERIRKIFQDAFSQTVAELKEGTDEIRSIAKDSKSTLTDALKEKPNNVTQDVKAPVEVIIEVDTEPATTKTVEMQNVAETIVQIDPVAEDAAQPSESSSVDALEIVPSTITDEQKAANQQTTSGTESTGLLEVLKVLLERAVQAVQSGEAYAKLKEQIGLVDSKLSARYGERYAAVKQEFRQDLQNAKTWYEGKKAETATSGTPWAEQKQAELNLKMDEAGATIASKEQKIKQLLKELWQTVSKA